jgi:hypothetical protein
MRDVAIPAAKVTAIGENLPQNIASLLSRYPSHAERILKALKAGHVRFPLFTAGKAKFTKEQVKKIEQNVRSALKEALRQLFKEELSESEIEEAAMKVQFSVSEVVERAPT